MLMRSLTDEVDVVRGPSGTAVGLRRRLGRAPQPRDPQVRLPGVESDPPAAGAEVVVARIEEEIDLANADRLGADIAKAVPSSAAGLVIDLSSACYIDSAGIGLLFKLSERLHRRRQHLAVAVPDESPVRRVLVMSAFDRIVEVAATVDDATSWVRTAGS